MYQNPNGDYILLFSCDLSAEVSFFKKAIFFAGIFILVISAISKEMSQLYL